jgi:hypothetical protein
MACSSMTNPMGDSAEGLAEYARRVGVTEHSGRVSAGA